ncbi:MAG: hypothetical protein LBS97_00610 [Treponema sp.]|jgi:hypothetical protein|nr:hypothetical protein [Treponema sp.]
MPAPDCTCRLKGGSAKDFLEDSPERHLAQAVVNETIKAAIRDEKHIGNGITTLEIRICRLVLLGEIGILKFWSDLAGREYQDDIEKIKNRYEWPEDEKYLKKIRKYTAGFLRARPILNDTEVKCWKT